MIKYFVRTTNSRKLDSSYSQIEYELLVDTEHNNGKAFLKQLEIINDYDAVLLEDDCILCKDFKNRTEDAIKEHPNELINFFEFPLQWKLPYHQTLVFSYNQCTYFPKGFAKKLLDCINENGLYSSNSTELMMKDAFKVMQYKHYIYRPCLVQHIDDGSLLNHKLPYKRRCIFFIDYLDELGITYDEANNRENRMRLRELMKDKFKDIDKEH